MSILVGRPAPDFTEVAIMPDNTTDIKFNFSNYIKDSTAVLFFWPPELRNICSLEAKIISDNLKEFHSRSVKVVGVSLDTIYDNLMCKNTDSDRGGIDNLNFPIVIDKNGEITSKYDVLLNKSISLLATFVIDKFGIVRHQSINDTLLNRHILETLRIIDGLNYYYSNYKSCPEGWCKGDERIENQKDLINFISNTINSSNKTPKQ